MTNHKWIIKLWERHLKIFLWMIYLRCILCPRVDYSFDFSHRSWILKPNISFSLAKTLLHQQQYARFSAPLTECMFDAMRISPLLFLFLSSSLPLLDPANEATSHLSTLPRLRGATLKWSLPFSQSWKAAVFADSKTRVKMSWRQSYLEKVAWNPQLNLLRDSCNL